MRTKLSVHELCMGALFCALTAVCSQLVVNIGVVPISLSLVAVYLCGALLAPRAALLAQLAYLALGVVGVPVFSNFGSGPTKVFGPTGGYLLAYPAMALLVALAVQKWGGRWWVLAAAMTAALAVCYAVGTAWLCWQAHLGLAAALAKGVLPFLAFDAGKIVLCCALAARLGRRVRRVQNR